MAGNDVARAFSPWTVARAFHPLRRSRDGHGLKPMSQGTIRGPLFCLDLSGSTPPPHRCKSLGFSPSRRARIELNRCLVRVGAVC